MQLFGWFGYTLGMKLETLTQDQHSQHIALVPSLLVCLMYSRMHNLCKKPCFFPQHRLFLATVLCYHHTTDLLLQQ